MDPDYIKERDKQTAKEVNAKNEEQKENIFSSTTKPKPTPISYTALVFGIISAALLFISLFMLSIITLPLSLTGVILSIIARKKVVCPENKMALILNMISLAVSVIVTTLLIFAFVILK